jgi:hypothetical protein
MAGISRENRKINQESYFLSYLIPPKRCKYKIRAKRKIRGNRIKLTTATVVTYT